jgi:glycosyltransferase involved in cell wall biosynthesis
VDRAARHLIPALAGRGFAVDLLKVRGHGPDLAEIPPGVRVVDLGSRHTYGCLPGLVRYLRREAPAVLLSDKDRVNRTALLARFLARAPTRLVLSSGTTISIDLATRGPLERWIQRTSMGRLYPFADQVIVTSAGVADDMAAYTGLPRGRIRVVPSPVVPESLFTAELPRPDHPWFHEPAMPLILSAGELCWRKGFDTLLRAFAEVSLVGVDILLEILADVLVNGVWRAERVIVIPCGQDQVHIPGVDQGGDRIEAGSRAAIVANHSKAHQGDLSG